MKRQWWKEGIVYQIYPRSFMDSNGDGIGDCRGIIEKLDYLKELGVNIIWLNPVYKSPNDDNGYDISDYKDIMGEFGTMADWEELLEGLHERGIKLIMDLVVNHSSDEHRWFVESKKSKDNPYRDYYIWKDPKYDQNGNRVEPTNWTSCFSGPAWEYSEETGQYYLHIFSKKQPDLNWENPRLREEIYNMMNWWFEKGIDGFRMDVVNLISKYPEYADIEDGKENKTYMNGPRLHEFLKEMNQNCMSKYDVMTVGECFGVSLEQGQDLVGADRKELDMIFQMEHVCLGEGAKGKWDIAPWKLTQLKEIIGKWDRALEECKGWGSQFLMNHDQPRSVSKFGNDKKYRVQSAKMLATFTLTLKGTPYIYQGEEIGMTNIKIDEINDYRDLEILNHYREAIVKGENHDKLMKAYNYKGRDNSRTPMQWDDSENAGFTKGTPWIKVNPNYEDINVEKAMEDKDSIFYYYKDMINLRKDNLGLVYGEYRPILEEDEKIYSYLRIYGDEQYLVVLNFSEDRVQYLLPRDIEIMDLLISNYSNGREKMELQPYESRVYKVKVS